MKARISNLYKTEAEWNELDFIPFSGEIIIYAPDQQYTYARIKVGDGASSISSLPFLTETCFERMITEFLRINVSDAGKISDYWLCDEN